MKPSLQSALNRKFKESTWDSNQLVLTGYHGDKVRSVVFGITEDVLLEENGQIFLRPCSDLKTLAKLFHSGNDPAGGWYLVREQREWLRQMLVMILGQKKANQTVRILEAGVASYVHHYTYLSVIADTLRDLKKDIRISLATVDVCAFPILQVAALEKELEQGLAQPKKVEILGIEFALAQDFIDFVNSHPRSFGSISTELWIKNMSNLSEMVELGCYDIITEHFLTSCIPENNSEIEDLRCVYGEIIRKGGYLLCAAGLRRDSEEYDRYVDLHSRNKLVLVDNEVSWDPYGHTREDIVQFGSEQPHKIPTRRGNTLSLFQKI